METNIGCHIHFRRLEDCPRLQLVELLGDLSQPFARGCRRRRRGIRIGSRFRFVAIEPSSELAGSAVEGLGWRGARRITVGSTAGRDRGGTKWDNMGVTIS